MFVEFAIGVVDIVHFVVALVSVANQVDHCTFVCLVFILECSLDALDDGLQVLRVDVDHGYVECLEYVSGELTGALVFKFGGEPDLVIGYDVYAAVYTVVAVAVELEHFVVGALPGQRCVPVHEHIEQPLGPAVLHLTLGLAHADGIYQFQVRRVMHHAHLQPPVLELQFG